MVLSKKNPIQSLSRGWKYLLVRQVRLKKKIAGRLIQMPDGNLYRVFRHMSKNVKNEENNQSSSLFMVKFKFKNLPFFLNRLLSLIPVPMIAGFPGFMDKIWMRDAESGYWFGLYQWESEMAIEEYKQSFVLGLMIKRADPRSISYNTIKNCSLEQFL